MKLYQEHGCSDFRQDSECNAYGYVEVGEGVLRDWCNMDDLPWAHSDSDHRCVKGECLIVKVEQP